MVAAVLPWSLGGMNAIRFHSLMIGLGSGQAYNNEMASKLNSTKGNTTLFWKPGTKPRLVIGLGSFKYKIPLSQWMSNPSKTSPSTVSTRTSTSTWFYIYLLHGLEWILSYSWWLGPFETMFVLVVPAVASSCS